VVKFLNDKYGIQTRGGCSCAGTYGHFLLAVDVDTSKIITNQIDHGDLSMKPGWIRMSIHPVMTNEEAEYIIDAIADVSANHKEYIKDYVYDAPTNEFFHKNDTQREDKKVKEWINTYLD
jgi:hypothetical protein